jgi:hypothetical protein
MAIAKTRTTRGYGIFIDTFCEGSVPSVKEITDGNNAPTICIYPTEREAQLEIADYMMTRLQEFIDGERDFDDAVSLLEYVLEIEVSDCGKITVVQ